jgi:hypothetical protein
VAGNTGGNPRSGTLTVAGQSFTVNQGGGLALTAIGASSTYPGHDPSRAVDGQLGTAWSSGGFPPASIDVDLGATQNLTRVRLRVNQVPDGNTTHELWAGPSVSSLSLIRALSGFTQAFTWLDASFSPAVGNVRVLRVASTASPSWVSWFEIEAYGTAAGGCSYSISPTSASFGAAAAAGSVAVAAGAGCAWTAASNASWLTVNSGAAGTGNGTVAYSVAANAGSSSRTGTLTVAGLTFTVTQSGSTGGCSYSLSKTTAVAPVTASTGLVGVTATAGCAWTAASNVPWITITSAAAGSGNGTVKYLVAANGSGAPRTGTVTIAGLTFTVFQDGP